MAGEPDSSPVSSGDDERGGGDGGEGRGRRDVQPFEQDLADGEVAAFARAVRAAPGSGPQTPPGDQAQAHQQPVGQGQDQQQPVDPLGLLDLRVPQGPAPSLILAVAKELLDGHPPSVELGQPLRRAVQVAHPPVNTTMPLDGKARGETPLGLTGGTPVPG